MAVWSARNATTKPSEEPKPSKQIFPFSGKPRSCVSDYKQPWVGLSQLNDESGFAEHSAPEMPSHSLAEQIEAADGVDLPSNRRDFLKMMGFGLGAATVAAACDIPRKYAVPYVTKPDTIVPGIANYYASSFISGGDFCPVLVKTREGRPIKIEGNGLASAAGLGAGTTTRAQASVLSLYDTERLSGPVRVTRGTEENAAPSLERVTWDELDLLVEKEIAATANVRIVTSSVYSPTTAAAIREFQTRFPNTRVVTYDAASSSALIQAHQLAFGQAAIPGYDFSKADVVLGIDCDFLGSWIFPSLFNEQYGRRRKVVNQLRPSMNRHYQIESTMSMTGSNADHRIRVKPSHLGQATIELHNQVASLTGGTASGSATLDAEAKSAILTAARDLVAARGAALVVSGSNNLAEQQLVARINQMLGAYGMTANMGRAIRLRQGIDADMRALIAEMQSGSVQAVIFTDDVNPAFDYPRRDQFVAALAKVSRKLSTSMTLTETSMLCDFIAPDHHILESWGDAEPIAGTYALVQPTIHQLWETRQFGESLLTWAKSTSISKTDEQPYREFLRKQWRETLFTQQNRFANFDAFWDMSLSDGIVVGTPSTASSTGTSAVAPATQVRRALPEGQLELLIPESVHLGVGQYANNPWLQEVPDPVARTTWSNYLQVPVTYKEGRNYSSFQNLNTEELKGKTDIVSLTVGELSVETPCVVQFGMAPDTLALSTGYGRRVVGKVGRQVGADVVPFLTIDEEGNRQNYAAVTSVSDVLRVDNRFAIVQYHHTMGVDGRDGEQPVVADEERTLFGGYGGIANGYKGSLTQRSIIRHADLADLPEFTEDLGHERAHHQKLNSHSLYEGHEDAYKLGHHWGMYVDLNSCTGCQACVVACISENNTPVVGKNEVGRHHEMTWLRIDRYYYGDVDNPQVVYQPMMCQHCDNAPCENVCPVAATNHSSEGLNQMTYNRCIGTRYCANNCPYKVRRFNWFDYTTADLFIGNEPGLNEGEVIVPVGGAMPFAADNLTRMVLNPDVTVRSRGVIEKCSFCVQRIQAGKLTAKQEGRRLRDADVKTACQTACPTGAITFGDRNNPDGELMKVWNAPINYLVLEEVNVAPSVMYSAKIKNRNPVLIPEIEQLVASNEESHS